MKIEKLNAENFSAFGDVVETSGHDPVGINQGFAERFNDLAFVDVAAEGGAVNISLFEARPRPAPIAITLMERHPLGSQLFHPLQNEDWLVLVCAHPLVRDSFRCFRASGFQGVNYARNVWHHPLLVFSPSRFLVVDRKGPGINLEEVRLPSVLEI